MKKLIVIITALMVLFTAGCSQLTPETEVTKETSMGLNLKASALHLADLTETGTRSAVTFSGEMKATNLDTGSVENFPWYAAVNVKEETIVSGKTIVLAPGTYDISLVLSRNNQSYVGTGSAITVTEGENSINITLNPVLGTLNANTDLTQKPKLTFSYPASELKNIQEPRMGIIVDNSAEQVFKINKTTGLSTAYVDLTPGDHQIKLNFYDGNELLGRSAPTDENQNVVPGKDFIMNIDPLQAETEFNLPVEGSDLTLNMVLPPQVIEEVGGIDNLGVLFQMSTMKNGAIEKNLVFTKDAKGNAVHSLTLPNFYYDTIGMVLTLTDKRNGEEVGKALCCGVVIDKNTQSITFNLTLIRRNLIKGNLRTVLALNALNADNSPAPGAEVYINGVFKGITGSSAFGTPGYIKLNLVTASSYKVVMINKTTNNTGAVVVNDPGVLNIINTDVHLLYKGVQNSGNKNIYMSINKRMNWNDAKLYSENLGGHLATFASEDENISGFNAGNFNPTLQHWIGLYEKSEGNWAWITGETLNYTNWYNGQPNNADVHGQDKGCIFEIDLGPDYKQWNDRDSIKTYYSICEFEID